MIEQSLSISEARRVISSLPDVFEEGIGVIIVTRSDKPVMVILPHSTYLMMQELKEIIDSSLEAGEILKDDRLMAILRQGVKEIAESQGQSLDEILRELNWE